MATQAAKKSPPKKSTVEVVAGDFRQGVAVKNLAKKLFDPSQQLSLDPTLITQILTAAGIKTPAGVKIGADTAQILLAGGAIVSNAQKGAEIGAYVKPSALGIRAVFDILDVTGLLKSNEPAAQIMRVGTDLAMVIASGGLNVFADISLVIDLIGSLFTSLPDRTAEYTEYAHYLNKKSFYDWYSNRLSLEKTAAAKNFANYQTGSIDCFEFIGEIALEAPDLFPNFFPELGFFFPPITAYKCFTSRVQKHDTGGIFGLQSRDYDIIKNDCFDYATIQNNRSRIQDAIFKAFVEFPAQAFFQIQKQAQLLNSNPAYYGVGNVMFDAFPKEAESLGVSKHDHPVRRIDIRDLAVLSMFPPYFKRLKPGMDIRPILNALALTPADLGYSVVEDELTVSDFAELKRPPEPGITFNGVDYMNPAREKAQTLYQANVASAQRLIDLDQNGNIAGLLKDPKAAKIIAEWGMPVIPGGNDPKYDEDPARDIQNLWSAVSVVSQLKKDKIFQKIQEMNPSIAMTRMGSLNLHPQPGVVNPDRSGFDFATRADGMIGATEWYDERFKELQFKSVARKMNALARKRIADFYGTTPDKLRFKKTTHEGELAAVIPA